jgi:hypothetical protein
MQYPKQSQVAGGRVTPLWPIATTLGVRTEAYRRRQRARLREFGGLQSYPSRAKDPDTVD